MKYTFPTLTLLFLTLFLQAQPISDFIHIDQFGYRLGDEKVAVISDPQTGFDSGMSFTPGATYQVRTAAGNNSVFSGNTVAWNGGATDAQSGNKAWRFDFSSVTAAGEYYIFDVTNNVKSYNFTIGDAVYTNVLKQAMRAFYYQRCGTAKATPHANANWVDGSCHLGANQDLDCRLVTDQGNAATAKDLSGGWHDAGDYNKYVNYTLNPVHDLLSAYEENPTVWGDDFNIPESGNGTPDILDEIKWELDWLLKMQLTDGSVLMKVAVTAHQGDSPPSTDNAAHYYGAAQSSATRTACSIFAHAAIVYNSIGMAAYANTLETKAALAWTWLQNNPGYSAYTNTGFLSSNPEVSSYDQEATSFAAAVYLFVLTNNAAYKTYVDANYANIHAIAWTFWYPFESVYQDALLYYATAANGTTSVQNTIKTNFQTSLTTNNNELLPAYLSNSSPYKAFISTDNYVWGSSKVKANTAMLYYNMITYSINTADNATYLKAAEDYVHYLHGVNPLNLVYLSNMNNFGAEKSCDEIYHLWFSDGTAYDNASSSLYGPAPGFVPGGPNKNFSPDATYTIAPPENQPPLKSYKDWNISYPENSWEITEPADGYQGAYVKMLSKFVTPSAPLAVDVLKPLWVELLPNNSVSLNWITAHEENNAGFEIQRSSDGSNFQKIGFVQPTTHLSTKNTYHSIDKSPLTENYYRYKQVDWDGHFSYSDVVHISVTQTYFKIMPNPISNGELICRFSLPQPAEVQLNIYDINGKKIQSLPLGHLSKGKQNILKNIALLKGIYFIELSATTTIMGYKKLIIN